MEGDMSKLALIRALAFSDLKGYFKYKWRALTRKPDMDMVLSNLYIGGETSKVPDDFEVYNIRMFPENSKIHPIWLEALVDTIHASICDGKKVFVHCRHGRGRAPLVAAAYMIKYYKFTVKTAIDYVKSCRPNTVLGVYKIHQDMLEELYNETVKSLFR